MGVFETNFGLGLLLLSKGAAKVGALNALSANQDANPALRTAFGPPSALFHNVCDCRGLR